MRERIIGMGRTGNKSDDMMVSGGKLLALDLGISTVGVAADIGIGWGIASGVFGAVMTPAIATWLGITATVGAVIGTGAMLLVQGASR